MYSSSDLEAWESEGGYVPADGFDFDFDPRDDSFESDYGLGYNDGEPDFYLDVEMSRRRDYWE